MKKRRTTRALPSVLLWGHLSAREIRACLLKHQSSDTSTSSDSKVHGVRDAMVPLSLGWPATGEYLTDRLPQNISSYKFTASVRAYCFIALRQSLMLPTLSSNSLVSVNDL